ncbi:MAG: TonB-dependent receptor [Caulobacteraceae bacterium]
MRLRRTLLIGSASIAALGMAVDSAMAADAASPTNVQEIVVPGIRQSLQKAIEIKRVSENSVDAVSSTDIGKLPDKNIADALQRLPGVDIQGAAGGEGGFDEADRVSIRGTSPSLTNVTIDGHDVSTGDWFILDQYSVVGRSVSFTLLPAEIVQNVVVYKTQDASLMEGGVSGAVDIQTRNPLSLPKTFTFEGSAEAAYNTNAGQHGSQWQPQVNALLGWKNQDDTFGVILQGFYEKRSVVRYGQEVLGWQPINAVNTPATAAALPTLIGDASPTLIGSSLFEQQRTREGVTGTVQWKTSDDSAEVRLNGFYSHLNASNYNDNYMLWGNHEFANNVPTSYTVKDGTVVAANFPTINPDGVPTDGLIVDNITRPNETAESYYVNLDGKFRLSDRLTIKAQVGYTHGVGETPEQPSFESNGVTGISYTPSGNGFLVDPTDINPQSPDGLANDWSWNARFTSVDKELYAKADGVWDVSNGWFKEVDFGVRIADHTRQVDGWDRCCTLGADNACFGSPTMPFANTNPTPYPSGFNAGALGIPGLLIPIGGNPTTIGQIIDAIPGGVRGPISAIVQPLNYLWTSAFKVQETDIAGYIMAHVGGDNWRGNFGVRVVNTDENDYVNSPNQLTPNAPLITTSAYGNYYINRIQHNYLDILPSANFTFDLQKNLLLRLSAAETMSRPDFSSLGGTVSLNDLLQVGSGGNADLKPVKAAVFDAGLEYYYGPESLVAVSVFYDDLSTYVGFENHTQTYFNMFLGMNTPYVISTPYNISGKLGGVEVQWQQPIGWGFGFQANGTYVTGHDADGAALIGTSEWTGNLVGYYESHGVSLRLAYTYRSHFYVGLDRASAESQANFGTLDASASYQLTPNVALTIDATNITNSLLKYYAANPTQVRAVYDNGTQLFMGVKVKF